MENGVLHRTHALLLTFLLHLLIYTRSKTTFLHSLFIQEGRVGETIIIIYYYFLRMALLLHNGEFEGEINQCEHKERCNMAADTDTTGKSEFHSEAATMADCMEPNALLISMGEVRVGEEENEEQGQQDDGKQEEGSKQEPMKPEKGDELICALCNEKISNDVETHLELHHSVLRRWCRFVLLKEKNEVMKVERRPEHTNMLGAFVLERVAHLDKGRKAFEVIQSATEQLNQIIEFYMCQKRVFLFGSCVSCGSWDGVGDADFTVLDLKLLRTSAWPPRREKDLIHDICRVMRRAGFLFEELQPIARTRVPVVRRVQQVREPLRISDGTNTFKIVYKYTGPKSRETIERLSANLQKRGALIESTTSIQLTASFHDGVSAISAFCRKEKCEMRDLIKWWKVDHPLPEIFSLDFDISCRPLGVRNSWLMRSYLSQRPEVRAGSAFLKLWSKESGINNPVKGYLTSYAITILWVYFLLRSDHVQYVDPAGIPSTPTLDQLNVPYIPLLRSAGDGDDSPSDVVQSPEFDEMRCVLSDLVAKFFFFYMNFSWETEIVTLQRRSSTEVLHPRSMGWVESNEVHAVKLRDCIWYRICIEDPYEYNLNLGRHLSVEKADFIKVQFVRAFAAVVHGQPQKLLVDERRLASATLPAMLHRMAVERGEDEDKKGIASLAPSEVLDSVVARLGEGVVALYELQHQLSTCYKGFLHAKPAKDDESSVASHLILHETDKKLREAGRLGIPVKDVANEVLGAYFVGCKRVLATAGERDSLVRHANAISRILSRGRITRSEVHVAMQSEIPAMMRYDALVDELLVDDDDGMAHLVVRVESTPAVNVMRTNHVTLHTHPPPQNEINVPLHPDGDFIAGECSQCGKKDEFLQGSNEKKKDPGIYCQSCWSEYMKL